MKTKYQALPLGHVEEQYLDFVDVTRPGQVERIMPVFMRGDNTIPMTEEAWATLKDAVDRYFRRLAWGKQPKTCQDTTITSTPNGISTLKDGESQGQEDGGSEPITKQSDNITKEMEGELGAQQGTRVQ